MKSGSLQEIFSDAKFHIRKALTHYRFKRLGEDLTIHIS